MKQDIHHLLKYHLLQYETTNHPKVKDVHKKTYTKLQEERTSVSTIKPLGNQYAVIPHSASKILIDTSMNICSKRGRKLSQSVILGLCYHHEDFTTKLVDSVTRYIVIRTSPSMANLNSKVRFYSVIVLNFKAPLSNRRLLLFFLKQGHDYAVLFSLPGQHSLTKFLY